MDTLQTPQNNITDGSYAKHFIIKSTDGQALAKRTNAFIVDKMLNGLLGIGHNSKITVMRNIGYFLISVDSKTKAQNIMKMTKIGEVEVKVEAHKVMNSSKGVVNCDCLGDESDQNILTQQLEGVSLVLTAHPQGDKQTCLNSNLRSPLHAAVLSKL